MSRPFSERVAGGDWRREAETWIGEELARHGTEVTGPVDQPRVRPWSTQMTVPTSAGLVWFKANCPSMSFEPALQLELSRLVPASVDAPLAVDTVRGWMLTADRGQTWGDGREPSQDDWRRVVEEAASLQAVLAGHRDEVLGVGVPDCSPATVVDRFDRLVDTFVALPTEHPSFVPPELASRLRVARSQVVDAAQQLAESAVPSTWQHGDLHPRNVFAVDGGALRLFDFGDSQWAHAVEVLSVPHGWISTYTSLDWGEVLEAYSAAWGMTPADLAADWRAASTTQPVNRTLLWWTALDNATAAEWADWGAGPLDHLTRVLDP